MWAQTFKLKQETKFESCAGFSGLNNELYFDGISLTIHVILFVPYPPIYFNIVFMYVFVGTRPTILSTSQPGKGGAPPNIQLVRTVLSQPGGAGQTVVATGGKQQQSTIVLAPQGGATTVAVSEGVANIQGVRTVHSTAAAALKAGKSGPVYARIITPPPGIRLATVRPGQPITGQVAQMAQVAGGVSVIQAQPLQQTAEGVKIVTTSAAANQIQTITTEDENS